MEVIAHLEACQSDVPVTRKISPPWFTSPSTAYRDGPEGLSGRREWWSLPNIPQARLLESSSSFTKTLVSTC